MGGWYVRDRGRVIGPFPDAELRRMRANRQLQPFHEVSRDRVGWQPIDLALEPLAGPAGPPVGHPPPTSAGRRFTAYRLVLGGAAAAVLVLAAVGAWLVVRANRGGPGTPTADTVRNGVIAFAAGTTAGDRDRVFKESVGLVVAGMAVTRADGSLHEIPEGTGTGFVVSPDGFVLTNRHVVEQMLENQRSPQRLDAERTLKMRFEPKVWVFFGRDAKFEAEVVYASGDYDVAVLKVARACPWYFALCDTDPADVPLLDHVSAVGFPGVDREAVTVKDQIEALVRLQSKKGPVQAAFPDAAFGLSKRDGSVTRKAMRNKFGDGERESVVLQHSAQIYGGNSGGPLLTRAGTVVGINTWARKEKLGINYALTLPQLRGEIAARVPNVTWQPLAE